MSSEEPTSRPLAALVRLCNHRRLALILAGLVALLCLPGLGVGYQIDDFVQQAVIRGIDPAGDRAPLAEMFAFMDGDPDRNRQLQDLGIVPWWSTLDLKARLWRPVTVLTHLVDDAVARDNAVLAHAHSIAWMVALALAALALFRRVHGSTTVAGLATLIYAVDEAHGLPTGWLANRNALITGVFGITTVLLYDRARRLSWRPGLLLAPLSLLVGLLAGEAAIAATAYLFAYAVFLDRPATPDDDSPEPARPPLLSRLLPLAPFAVVVIGWRCVYSALGYGTHSSGLYIDPATDPGAFLGVAPHRILSLLGDQFASLPSMVSAFIEPSHRWMLAAAALPPLLLLAWLGRRLLRGSPEAGFWLTGMLLATLPVAATFPAARLLTFVGLGGAALTAMLIARALLGIGGAVTALPRGARPTAWALLMLHLLLAPLLLPGQVWSPKILGDFMFNPCDVALPDDPSIEGKTAIFVNSNDLCVAYMKYRRLIQGRPAPLRARLLASAIYSIDVTGVDSHTLDVHIPAGMQSTAADTLLRSPEDPFPVGATIELEGMSFEVLSWNDVGLVDRVRVRSEVPLRDPSLVWRCAIDRAPAVFVPPEPGETVHLPGAFQ